MADDIESPTPKSRRRTAKPRVDDREGIMVMRDAQMVAEPDLKQQVAKLKAENAALRKAARSGSPPVPENLPVGANDGLEAYLFSSVATKDERRDQKEPLAALLREYEQRQALTPRKGARKEENATSQSASPVPDGKDVYLWPEGAAQTAAPTAESAPTSTASSLGEDVRTDEDSMMSGGVMSLGAAAEAAPAAAAPKTGMEVDSSALDELAKRFPSGSLRQPSFRPRVPTMTPLKRSTVDVSAERATLLAAEQKVQEKDAEFYKQSLWQRAKQWKSGSGATSIAEPEKQMNVAASAYKQKLESKLAARQGEKTAKGEDRYVAMQSVPLSGRGSGGLIRAGFETGAMESHIKVELPTTQPVPPIAVEAAKGEGYDTMIKRIWTDTQGKGMNPNMFPVGSDLHRLLIADDRSIDRVARLIAADPKHQFFGAPSAGLVLELGADGNLHVLGAGEKPVAPPVAHVEVQPTAEAPALTTSAPETLATAVPPPTASPASVPEAPVATVPEHLEAFTNSHGVTVDPTSAAVYEDINGAFVVYGGKGPAEWLAAATAYAKAHIHTQVWVQAGSPVPYQGAMHPWAYPVTYHGLFRGGMEVAERFSNPDHQLGAVVPDRFTKQLA